jgi:hypothetical protein
MSSMHLRIYYMQVCASLMYADVLEGIYYLQVCASLMYADILEGICMEVCMFIVCRYFFYLARIEVDGTPTKRPVTKRPEL